MNVTLHNESHRTRALGLVAGAPIGFRVTVEEPARNTDQNRRMWAMIGDILEQRGDWFGPGLDKDDLKQIFMSSLFRELRMARNADGDGYIPLARRSSRLTVRQMADLITLSGAWGDQHGVVWSEPSITRDGAGSKPALMVAA